MLLIYFSCTETKFSIFWAKKWNAKLQKRQSDSDTINVCTTQCLALIPVYLTSELTVC